MSWDTNDVAPTREQKFTFYCTGAEWGSVQNKDGTETQGVIWRGQNAEGESKHKVFKCPGFMADPMKPGFIRHEKDPNESVNGFSSYGKLIKGFVQSGFPKCPANLTAFYASLVRRNPGYASKDTPLNLGIYAGTVWEMESLDIDYSAAADEQFIQKSLWPVHFHGFMDELQRPGMAPPAPYQQPAPPYAAPGVPPQQYQAPVQAPPPGYGAPPAPAQGQFPGMVPPAPGVYGGGAPPQAQYPAPGAPPAPPAYQPQAPVAPPAYQAPPAPQAPPGPPMPAPGFPPPQGAPPLASVPVGAGLPVGAPGYGGQAPVAAPAAPGYAPPAPLGYAPAPQAAPQLPPPQPIAAPAPGASYPPELVHIARTATTHHEFADQGSRLPYFQAAQNDANVHAQLMAVVDANSGLFEQLRAS